MVLRLSVSEWIAHIWRYSTALVSVEKGRMFCDSYKLWLCDFNWIVVLDIAIEEKKKKKTTLQIYMTLNDRIVEAEDPRSGPCFKSVMSDLHVGFYKSENLWKI